MTQAYRLLLSQIGATVLRPSGYLLSIRQVFATGVFVVVLNLGTGLIAARLLGPAGRGELTAMQLWPNFAAGLLTLGLQPSLTYNLASRRAEPRGLVLIGLLMTAFTGLLAAGCGVLFVPIWLQEYPPHVVTFAQWAMLMAPVFLLIESARAIQQAEGKFRLYNRSKYFQPLICLITLGILAVCGTLTPTTAALAFFGSFVPILVANLVWIMRTQQLRFAEPVRSFSELLSYGLRSYGIRLVHTLARQIDRVVLIALISPAALGLYVVAKSLAQPTVALPNAVVTVLFPEVARGETSEMVSLLARATQIGTAVSCIMGLGLVLAGPTLLGLLYGEAFAPAVDAFRLLLIGVILGGASEILMQAFMGSGRPGIVSTILLLGLGVHVLGMLLLVPAYGLQGAGLALLLSGIVRFAATLICFPLFLNVRILSLLPQRRDLRTLVARLRAVG